MATFFRGSVSLRRIFSTISCLRLVMSKQGFCVKIYNTGNFSVGEKHESPKWITESAPTCSAATPSTQHSPYEVSPNIDTLKNKCSTDMWTYRQRRLQVGAMCDSDWLKRDV